MLTYSWLLISSGAFVQAPLRVAGRQEVCNAQWKMMRGAIEMTERRGLWPQKLKIDLRSDTVTLPTGGMRKAMQKVKN